MLATYSRLALLAALLTPAPALPQGIITTFAGTDWIFAPPSAPALQAPLSPLLHVTLDSQGRPVFADPGNNTVFRLNPDATLTLLAGNGISAFSGEGGPATAAALNTPQAVAYDSRGNLYISDFGNNRIRRVTPAGIISTFAGSTTTTGFAGDNGPALRAVLSGPGALAVDATDNLYFVDRGNHRIRRISPDGLITTFAGLGQPGFSGDGGPALRAALNGVEALATDRNGNLYLADFGNHRLRRIAPNGTITTLAGLDRNGFAGDNGPATQALLNGPSGVALDPAGNIYLSDSSNHRIRRISPTGTITTFAGTTRGFAGDNGPATTARLNAPFGLTLDATGNLLLADRDNFRLRSISPAGIINTLAGNARFRFNPTNTPARTAFLFQPQGLALDVAGTTTVIADSGNNYLRLVQPNGNLFTLFGTGVRQTDGVSNPIGVAVDRNANIYIADTDNHIIRRISAASTLSLFAGTGVPSFSGDDGPATAAAVNAPTGLAVDTAGNLFFSDTGNKRIRRIAAATGIITTFAGGGPRVRENADNFPAREAALEIPSGLAFDRSGNLLFADSGSSRVRRITPDGRLTTLAGGGTRQGRAGDNFPATEAALVTPFGLAVDPTNTVFFSDALANTVRRISPTGTLATIAGNGEPAFSGDGDLSTRASLSSPRGLALDLAGNLLIADMFNHRIRAVLAQPINLRAAPATLSFSAQSGGPLTAAQLLTLSAPPSALTSSLAYTATSPVPWLQINNPNGLAPATLAISANPANLAPGTYSTILILAAPTAGATTPVNISFTVLPPDPPVLAIDRVNLTFPLLLNAEPLTESVLVNNTGGGSPTYTATVRTESGGNWLALTPATGRVSPATPAALSLTANPRGLAAGTYKATLTVTAPPAAPVSLPLVMTITGPTPRIRLSQTGLTFTAVANSATSAPQEITISNSGSGDLRPTVTSSTLSGGASWLTVTNLPDSRLRIAVNGAALAPGNYFGRVDVRAPGAINSPQTVTVLLNVLPPTANPGPQVEPSALVFVSPAGQSPGAQTVTVSNLTGTPTAYTLGTTFANRSGWLKVAPVNSAVLANNPVSVTVQPDFANLPPGIHEATLNLTFDDGTVRSVTVLAIASDPAEPANDPKDPTRLLTACVPNAIRPAFTTPQQIFNATLNQPVPFELILSDNCGNLITTGTVSASLSNRDTIANFTHTSQGRWTTSWLPRNASPTPVRISVTAFINRPNSATLTDQFDFTARLTAPITVVPLVSPGAVLNGASFEPSLPVAPGSLISLFGARLADAVSIGSAPLPTVLSGTEVALGESRLPLLYTSDGQLNAMVPYDIPVNAQLQLLVRRGDTLSFSDPLTVAPAQPAIFTQNQQGTGQAAIVNGVTNVLADAANPVSPGTIITIYCTGLGEVSPAITAGQAASLTVLSRTTQPVTVQIANQPANVTFAGLAPGFAGLYQVNAAVPSGLPANDQTPITLTIAGQTSPPVTFAVR